MLKRVASSVPVHSLPFCSGRLSTTLFQLVLTQQRNSLNVSNTMTSAVSTNSLAEFVSTQDANGSIQIVPHNEIPSNALIVKSLVWTYHKTNPVLIVLDLASSVDKAKLAKYLQLNHVKHLRMATPEQVLSTTGQEVGNVSPIGHREPVRTIVDESLLTFAGTSLHSDFILYGGGGSSGFQLKLSLQDLLYYSKGEIADIRSVKEPNAEPSPVLACDDNKLQLSVTTEPVHSETILGAVLPVVLDSTQVAAFAKQVRDLAIQKESYPKLQVLLQSLHTAYSVTQPELFNTIVNSGTSTSGKTALHLASWKGSIASVRLLIHYGADVNAFSIGSGNYGKTAIFYAITQCRDDVVNELLKQSASVKIVNNKGQTPRSLGPSHLAEDTICLIEQHEIRDKGEWLNFYTTHYCDSNTCFGDLDPRFQADAICNNTDGVSKLPLPRSINATTFEFRRNHFKSYTKKAHHIDDLVVALLRADTPISDILTEYVGAVDCTTISIYHTESTKHIHKVNHTHVAADTFVGYVASVSTCSEAIARVLPITQYLHTHSSCTLDHPHALKWTIPTHSDINVTINGATIKDTKDSVHKIHYEYLQLHSHLHSAHPALYEGDIVVVKGIISVTQSAISCTPASTMTFHTNTGGNSTTNIMSKSAALSHKALKKAAKAKRVEKSTTKTIEEDIEINVITGEASLGDIKDSFVPTVSAPSDNESAAVVVTVVDSMETLLQLDRDVQSLLNVACRQKDRDKSSISGDVGTYVDSYIAANPSRLFSIIGLDCEWRPGETYLRYLERQKAREQSENHIKTSTTTAVTSATTPVDAEFSAIVNENTADVEKEMSVDEDDEYRVAILQIATRTGVYLLDMQELTACMFNNIATDTTITGSELPPTLSQLNKTLCGLFSSPHVLKLGFKVAPDFEKLAASYPFLSCFTRIQSVVDTCTVAQHCVPGYVKQGFLPEYWMSNKRLKQLSLTKLLAMVLNGKGLSKEQQCSRWHLRPLTPEQISYGALDAASLLTIFDFFTMRDFPILDANSVAITTDSVLEHKIYRICSSSLKYHVLGTITADGNEEPLFTGPGMIFRTLLGVQIVAQSWALQQEEPIDYTIYAAQQAALQLTEDKEKPSSATTNKFKKLSELFVISPAVTDFIRTSTRAPLSPAHCSDKSSQSKYFDFLGEYISSSKDTCVEFVQALRTSETQLAAGSPANRDTNQNTATALNGEADAGPVISKMQNGMAMVEDTMVVFVNFPAAVEKNKTGNITDENGCAVSISKTTDSLFLCNGEYVQWMMDAPLLVRENSSRVGTIRSLLLQSFVSDSSAASVPHDASSVANSVLLFVRQNAGPYVYCGKVEISSISATIPAQPGRENIEVNNVASAIAAPVGSAVLDSTLHLLHYDLLFGSMFKPTAEIEPSDDAPLYRNMILRSLGLI